MGAASDADVLAASIDEPAAFAAVFDRHAEPMLRFLVRRAGVDVGESLVGELFRVAFEKRATFDVSRESARPWLYGIASNLLRKHRRSEARRLRATARYAALQQVSTDLEGHPDEAVDAGNLWPRLATAIDGLPAGERDALLLYAWEDLSYEDVAIALAIPIGTVRSRLNRARRRLRDEATGAESQAGCGS